MRFLYPLLGLQLLAAAARAQTAPVIPDIAVPEAPTSVGATAAPAIATPADKPNFIPVPVLFYQQETGFGYGGAILPVWRFGQDSTVRKSNARLIAWYTQKKQSTIQLTHTVFTPNEKFYFAGELSQYDLSFFYYGLGNDTKSSDESTIGYKLFVFDEKFMRRITAHNLYGGLRYRLTNTSKVRVIEDISETQPSLFRTLPQKEQEGGVVSGLGPSLLYEGRDNVLATYRGIYIDAHALFTGKGLGSDYTFQRYQLDLRYFRPLLGSNNTILALQYLGQFHSGSVPFRELGGLGANLGGSQYNNAALMRGLYEARFRGRQMMTAQAEIRQHLFWRLDGAAFLGAGQVGNTVGQYSFGDTKLAGGAGLRFRFNRRDRLNIRLDYAGGTDTAPSIYFAVGEAF
ncbi:BamA/TamA family outer membrane protein [Hymenobacter cellulosilyticus]|uniref:Outer membrane protein assembly factor n=1 Tax=Hymenobacter cellulosilyticus TaxID=2932248 RepID=A0A8T9Q9V6_9BACT|nr:BamA/TamA family outer membrane protein [Hymenobacter cellulosilyticus]UOQ73915.1 outer membrane protein assembly factor [Hymenobacter cellulosilyticus]